LRNSKSGQLVGRPDRIVIEAHISVDQQTQNAIMQLPEAERIEFLWELRFELLRTELEFNDIDDPLKDVHLLHGIFIDALDRDTLLRRTVQIRKGIQLVEWVLEKKFKTHPPQRRFGFST
jgi:hypothetical protein